MRTVRLGQDCALAGCMDVNAANARAAVRRSHGACAHIGQSCFARFARAMIFANFILLYCVLAPPARTSAGQHGAPPRRAPRHARSARYKAVTAALKAPWAARIRCD